MWCKVLAGESQVFCSPMTRSQPLVTCWAMTISSASLGWPPPPSPPLLRQKGGRWVFLFPDVGKLFSSWRYVLLRSLKCSDTFLNGFVFSSAAWSRREFFFSHLHFKNKMGFPEVKFIKSLVACLRQPSPAKFLPRSYPHWASCNSSIIG